MKHTQEEYLAWIDSTKLIWERRIANEKVGDYPDLEWIKETELFLASLLANRDVLDEKPKAEIQGEFVDRLNERQIGWNLCLEALQKKITNRLDEVMG